MFCSNKLKVEKRIFQQGVNYFQRYYASAIQLPFHPHYVPPGQPLSITTTSTIRRQKKNKEISKTSSNSSTTFGISSFNNTQQSQLQLFPISVLKNPANSMIFQLGLVQTINRLQEASFSKREDILLSTNFFGGETSKRKIPFLFRISTICFIVASLIRIYHRKSNLHMGNKSINNRLEEKSMYVQRDLASS